MRERLEETLTEPSKYLPYYAQLYSEILSTIRETITSMVRSAGDATLATLEPARTYDGLLESGLSEQYNDASLILRKMSKLKGMGWPERFDEVNGCALQRAAAETLRFAEQCWDRRGWFGSARLRATVLGGIASVSLCITTTRGQYPELDLGHASATFLDTAEALEVMLWDLLRRESGEQDVTASNWDAAQVVPLADILGGLALSEPSPPRDTAGKADPITFDTSSNQ
jgi:hypothetical protein